MLSMKTEFLNHSSIFQNTSNSVLVDSARKIPYPSHRHLSSSQVNQTDSAKQITSQSKLSQSFLDQANQNKISQFSINQSQNVNAEQYPQIAKKMEECNLTASLPPVYSNNQKQINNFQSNIKFPARQSGSQSTQINQQEIIDWVSGNSHLKFEQIMGHANIPKQENCLTSSESDDLYSSELSTVTSENTTFKGYRRSRRNINLSADLFNRSGKESAQHEEMQHNQMQNLPKIKQHVSLHLDSSSHHSKQIVFIERLPILDNQQIHAKITASQNGSSEKGLNLSQSMSKYFNIGNVNLNKENEQKRDTSQQSNSQNQDTQPNIAELNLEGRKKGVHKIQSKILKFLNQEDAQQNKSHNQNQKSDILQHQISNKSENEEKISSLQNTISNISFNSPLLKNESSIKLIGDLSLCSKINSRDSKLILSSSHEILSEHNKLESLGENKYATIFSTTKQNNIQRKSTEINKYPLSLNPVNSLSNFYKSGSKQVSQTNVDQSDSILLSNEKNNSIKISSSQEKLPQNTSADTIYTQFLSLNSTPIKKQDSNSCKQQNMQIMTSILSPLIQSSEKYFSSRKNEFFMKNSLFDTFINSSQVNQTNSPSLFNKAQHNSQNSKEQDLQYNVKRKSYDINSQESNNESIQNKNEINDKKNKYKKSNEKFVGKIEPVEENYDNEVYNWEPNIKQSLSDQTKNDSPTKTNLCKSILKKQYSNNPPQNKSKRSQKKVTFSQ